MSNAAFGRAINAVAKEHNPFRSETKYMIRQAVESLRDGTLKATKEIAEWLGFQWSGGCHTHTTEVCKETNGRNGGYSRYPYVGFTAAAFYSLLKSVDPKLLKGRFMDIGGGLGDKAFLAYALCPEIETGTSLEYDRDLCCINRYLYERIFNHNYSRDFSQAIINEDALDFDGYGDYDVLYTYNIMGNRELQARMMSHIVESMSPGTLLLDVGYGPHVYRDEDGAYTAWDRYSPEERLSFEPEQYEHRLPVNWTISA